MSITNKPGCPDVPYCWHCKHAMSFEWDDPTCRVAFTLEHDHSHCWEKHEKCEVKNKDNDCKDFELTWWRNKLKCVKNMFEESKD